MPKTTPPGIAAVQTLLLACTAQNELFYVRGGEGNRAVAFVGSSGEVTPVHSRGNGTGPMGYRHWRACACQHRQHR